MRVPVKCKNCGIYWERVTAQYPPSEMNEDLQYNCPQCGSNWYEVAVIEEKDASNAK